MVRSTDYVSWLKDLDSQDRFEFGEELVSLSYLFEKGISVQNGFIITPDAFRKFKKDNDLHTKIGHLLGTVNNERHESVTQTYYYIVKHLVESEFPKDLVEDIFKFHDEYRKSKDLELTAFYVRSGELYQKKTYVINNGEAALVEAVRNIWTRLFDLSHIVKNKLNHETHEKYNISILIREKLDSNLRGFIKTVGDGNRRHIYEIEAESLYKLEFDKARKKVVKGYIFNKQEETVLDAREIKDLVDVAEKADKLLLHPHKIHWEKNNKFFITSILPVADAIEYYKNKNILFGKTYHPGISIGQAKIIDFKSKSAVISTNEVIIVKEVTKEIAKMAKKAKALIVEGELDGELGHYVKLLGIPTVSHVKDATSSYRDGEVISVNGLTGEVKRGHLHS